MNLSSIREISYVEIDQVGGGVNAMQVLSGALAGGAIKTFAYYIEVLMPKGEKDTFKGEVWNGFVKGLTSVLSAAAIGIPGAYIVEAVRNHPNAD